MPKGSRAGFGIKAGPVAAAEALEALRRNAVDNIFGPAISARRRSRGQRIAKVTRTPLDFMDWRNFSPKFFAGLRQRHRSAFTGGRRARAPPEIGDAAPLERGRCSPARSAPAVTGPTALGTLGSERYGGGVNRRREWLKAL
jgi:hypothetical protein